MKRSHLEEIRARWGSSEEFFNKKHSLEEVKTLVEQAYVDSAALFEELQAWEELASQIEACTNIPAPLNLERTARIKELVGQFMKARRG